MSKHLALPVISIRKWRAFTLIEILVVVAILCLLAAILFPAFNHVRSLGRRTTCASNLRQIGMALSQYAQDYKFYPIMDSAGSHTSGNINPDGVQKDSHCGAWPDKVLPYTKSQSVFKCPSAPNMQYQSGCPLPDQSDPQCPLTFRGAYTFNMPFANYSSSAGGGASETFNFRQGASPVRYTRPATTILILDSDDRTGSGGIGGFIAPGYTQPPPTDIVTLRKYGVPDRHEGGVNVCFADGHVKWMRLDSLLKVSFWRINGPE